MTGFIWFKVFWVFFCNYDEYKINNCVWGYFISALGNGDSYDKKKYKENFKKHSLGFRAKFRINGTLVGLLSCPSLCWFACQSDKTLFLKYGWSIVLKLIRSVKVYGSIVLWKLPTPCNDKKWRIIFIRICS